ncbi:hypothetical protein ABZT08_26465 [Streptomyces sp. NPDC005526]|uniref:hypothetical protein n=1 Tax=Streptomyces sp. NPDC005526 TaxID=3156885 RepID=UPI0033B21C54
MALSEPFPEDVRRARWLGRAGAGLEEAGALEDRLGAVLPASYRQFSLTSDGWLNTTPDIVRILSRRHTRPGAVPSAVSQAESFGSPG